MSSRPNPHISYDLAIRPHHKVIADLVNEFSTDNASVLDIGCGMGHMDELIKTIKPTLNLTIADIDKVVLETTISKVSVVDAIEILDVETLFKLGIKYDIVIMSHVLEHTYRPVDIIRGIMDNVLNENGYLILAVPNLGRLEIALFHLFRRHYVNKGHVYGWDRSHWINLLENILGLNVVRYQPDYFSIPKLKRFKIFMPVLVLMAKLFPWYSYSNISVIKWSKCKI